MNRMLKYSMLAILFLCMSVSSAWALLYEITYEKTFVESELFYLYDGQLFGVTQSTAPHLARVSFYLDTEAAPIYYYGAGSSPSPTYPLLALLHDLYGYDISAISNFTATFGNKTWA